MKKMLFALLLVLTTAMLVLALLAFPTCTPTGDDDDDNVQIYDGDYVVLAWNDLGMHCLNPTYDTAVILPPYNTVWAQVIKRGATPEIITSGITVDYRIIDNTYSYGKRNFGQFWDYAQALFGVTLVKDTGLNLVDPNIHNGLSGSMVMHDNHFEVDGIPVTPVNDKDTWSPFQVAEITVKDNAGKVLATTQATVPTSDEINCAKCHGSNAFQDILVQHDAMHKTNLVNSKPVLCASCHGSPALGQTGPGPVGKYLSEAIHTAHADNGAACYDCHPGAKTQCNRSLAHTSSNGNCVTCHGDLAEVGGSITSGQRIPWVNEPKCSKCHANVAEVDTGTTLYRHATGHNGLYCASCHSSPHAMVPSREASDNYQALQYQGKAETIGSCSVCHNSSKGPGEMDEFSEVHGGTTPEVRNACAICHTNVSSNTTDWPHSFQWKAR